VSQAGGSGIAGTVLLQTSNDIPPNSGLGTANQPSFSGAAPWAPTNWTSIGVTNTAIVPNGSVEVPPVEIACLWIRLVYVSTAGASGTMTGNVSLLGYGN
jgi:hypothetical protein